MSIEGTQDIPDEPPPLKDALVPVLVAGALLVVLSVVWFVMVLWPDVRRG